MRINRWCGWASLGIVRASETENGSKSKCIFGVSGYRRSYPILMISRCRTFSTWKHLFYWAEHEWFKHFFPPISSSSSLTIKAPNQTQCMRIFARVCVDYGLPPILPPAKKPLDFCDNFRKMRTNQPEKHMHTKQWTQLEPIWMCIVPGQRVGERPTTENAKRKEEWKHQISMWYYSCSRFRSKSLGIRF